MEAELKLRDFWSNSAPTHEWIHAPQKPHKRAFGLKSLTRSITKRDFIIDVTRWCVYIIAWWNHYDLLSDLRRTSFRYKDFVTITGI